jgi:hypothetical protein
MLGGTEISIILGSAPARDADSDTVKAFIRAACGAGLQLLLIDPDGKTPLDLRTKVARNKADREAAEAARAEGRKNWSKVRSKAGVHLATDDAKLVVRYFEAFRKARGETAPVNFAVRVAHPLVIADCDTAEQRDAFYEFMAEGEEPVRLPYTVSSPGAQDEDGNWKHRHGGHFYFLNEGEPIDRGTGTITADPGGWALIYRDRYVLIPPSVRPEGPYRLTGREYPMPDRLRAVADKLPPRKDRTEPVSGDLAESISAWAVTMSWDDILTADGWTKATRNDGACGCEVWTAPGEHGSLRSATAHDSNCGLARYEETDNAPIHIWTDNPGEAVQRAVDKWGKTLTKLQVWSAISYDGEVGKTIEGEGLSPLTTNLDLVDNPSDPSTEDADADPNQDFSSGLGSDTPPPPNDPPPPPSDGDDEPDPTCPHVAVDTDGRCLSCGVPIDDAVKGEPDSDDNVFHLNDMTIAPFAYWRDLTPPEFMIEGLIEQGGLTCIVGPPNVGKSTVAIDWMASIALGQPWQGRATKRQRVLYLPGEGLHGAVSRIRSWEAYRGASVAADLILANEILLVTKGKEDWSALAGYITRMQIGLVVIDTFARANLGMEENSATDVGKSIERFRQVQKATSAGVMVVHHTARGADHARGSTALSGALDSEVLLKAGDPARLAVEATAIDLFVNKQKNAAKSDEPMLLSMVPFGESVVIAGSDGVLGDPMDVVDTARTLRPEPRIELAIRIARALQRYDTLGLTRAEIAATVPMSPYIATRGDARDKAWRIAINEAVDTGLRFSLIRYAANSTAKFRRDTATFDAARQAAIEAGMADD